MKKGILKIVTKVFIVAVLLLFSIAPAFASGVTDFTASLSVSRRMNYVGEEVQFTVHIENTGDYEILIFSISNIRGGVIKEYGELDAGESADVPVTKVFNSAGEFGVKFKVTGSNSGTTVFVTTNMVTVTINNPKTPEPTSTQTPASTPEPSPTPASTPEPSQTPASTPEPSQTPMSTPEPSQTQALEATPTQVVVLREDEEDTPTKVPEESFDAQSSGAEQEGSNSVVLYIILAVVGASLLAAVFVIIKLKRKMKTDKGK